MNSLLTIGEILHLQAQQAPTSPFLHLPEARRSVTFSEMASLTGDIETVLRQVGLVAGSRVAVLLHNGLAAATTLLAIMVSNAVAVPLNPRLTRDELLQALELSRTDFLVCDEVDREAVATKLGAEWLWVDGYQAFASAIFVRSNQDSSHAAAPEHASDGDHPALILFTSGTTGVPKGVVLSHRNLLANASYVRCAHLLAPGDTALCVLPFFHINGLVVTLLTPLLTGHAVVVPTRFDAAHFWEWIETYRVTWFSAVPTILSLLLSSPVSPRQQVSDTLRFARSASAPLPVAVLDAFERRFGVPVIETYGISEAACQVTANPLPPSVRKPGSAGKPVGNELAVIDESGAELSIGNTGEVVIRGGNVFSGYLDNPEADREALRNGWFHTGDLGYLDEDGYLFLTGRKKELINRAGEKIAPREVEEIIHQLPEVESVGVVGVPDALYGEEVAAFITLRAGHRLELEQVTSHCREHLIGFKVPKKLFFIDELPKGPSGKVQRRRLLDVYARVTEKNS